MNARNVFAFLGATAIFIAITVVMNHMWHGVLDLYGVDRTIPGAVLSGTLGVMFYDNYSRVMRICGYLPKKKKG